MGEVFAGRYELVDPIGRGGVGEVWRAWDHRRRRYVACKVLLQRDAHSLLRFVREQALRIDHPHVLAPTSWAADDDKVLFTMDLVHGGSLAHLIGDYGALPSRLVITLLDQLLAGLTAVHAEGVVHRDIKPANLLLEATGTGHPHLRLSDFGIAVRTGDARLTETNYVVGTPGYFAPEQMLGAEPDFPQDLFAVGLVALYMLTGQKPDAETLMDSYSSGGFPAAPDGVSHILWQVVASLLNPDPQARFRTATGVRKALEAAREVLPEGSPDDESVEVFDHLGPLPEGFGPDGPSRPPGITGAGGLSGMASLGGRGTNQRTPEPATGGGQVADPRSSGGHRGLTGHYMDGHGADTSGSGIVSSPTGATTSGVPDGTGTSGTAGNEPMSDHLRQGTPPLSMSETGSFVLAPPDPSRVPLSRTPPPRFPQDEPGVTPSQMTGGTTRPYTSDYPAHQPAVGRTRRPRRPSRKVVVSMLVAAALCFAVGIWALATG